MSNAIQKDLVSVVRVRSLILREVPLLCERSVRVRRAAMKQPNERPLSAAHNAVANGAEYSRYLRFSRFSAHAAAGK